MPFEVADPTVVVPSQGLMARNVCAKPQPYNERVSDINLEGQTDAKPDHRSR